MFHTVVSFTHHDTSKAQQLLESGADPTIRASVRKQRRYMGNPNLEKMYEFKDVTAVEYARQFQVQGWVSKGSIKLIESFLDL
ncbi:MAG: hypothetical protein OEQ53_18530 [Saprospiraceae bacterium]|nr:hypothetical protein [Saprospiraceae bacterium]